MKRNKIKKLLIGTAIFLATTIPVFGKESKLERYIMFSKNDSFIQSPYKLAQSEKRILERMDELAVRLHKDEDGMDWSETIDTYCNEDFRIERDIVRMYRKRTRPRRALSYKRYRELYELDDKIRRAPGFLKEYKEELEEIEKIYGFDKRQIVSTVGMECNYGDFLGDYYAYNALVAMFASDRKKEFGYTQMKEYIKFCEHKNVDLFKYKSSPASAIGYAQHIPDSLNKYSKERDPMNMIDCFHIICEHHLADGWDPEQNHEIPKKGSRNWESMYEYNNSGKYVRARNEIAEKAKWDPADLNYKVQH